MGTTLFNNALAQIDSAINKAPTQDLKRRFIEMRESVLRSQAIANEINQQND